jgi:hypothetical protein
MPDDPNDAKPVGDTPAPQVTTEPTPAVKTFTPEEFNHHLAGQRRKSEAAEAELKARIAELEAGKAAAKPAKGNGKPEPTSDMWEPKVTDYRAMERTITRLGLALNDRQYDYMEKALAAEHPTDIGAWAKAELAAMGWAKPVDDKPSDNADPPKETPPAGAKSDQGPPAAAVSWEDKKSPLEWSKEDVQRILEEKGEFKGRRYIRERMESFLKGVVVVPPPRGT